MEEPELHGGRGARVARDQVAELAQDVAADLHHVLVAGGGLEKKEKGRGTKQFYYELRPMHMNISISSCSRIEQWRV